MVGTNAMIVLKVNTMLGPNESFWANGDRVIVFDGTIGLKVRRDCWLWLNQEVQ